MAKPLKLQIVERARALIADEQHWCRGELVPRHKRRGSLSNVRQGDEALRSRRPDYGGLPDHQ
jgi:hypothetical protein